MAIIAFQGLKTAVLGPRALGRRVHEMPVGYELGELEVVSKPHPRLPPTAGLRCSPPVNVLLIPPAAGLRFLDRPDAF